MHHKVVATCQHRMSANAEEARRALGLGREWLSKGDIVKALKYFRISSRLHSTEEVEILIRKTEKEANPPTDHSKNTHTQNHTTTTNSSSSNLNNSSDNNNTNQEEAVIRVLKATTLYERLGVKKSSSVSEIRKAYRKLALQLHPDKNSHPKADEAFKAIAEAFEVLSDADKKRDYDMLGKTKTSQGSSFSRFHGASGDDVDAEILRHFQFFFDHPSNRMRFTRQQRRSPPAPNTQNPFQSLLFILLNGLFLVAVFFPVIVPYFEEKPIFSLRKTSYHTLERQTQMMNVRYFVSSNFENDLEGSVNLSLEAIENLVEKEFFAQMQAQCSREKQTKQYFESKARSLFMLAEEKERYRQAARELEMPGCDFVKMFREGKRFVSAEAA